MKNLSVFDLDHTLVCGNSSFHFCLYLFRKKVLPFSAVIYALFCYLRHYILRTSLQDLHKRVFDRLLLGRSLESLESHVGAFLEEYLKRAVYHPAFLRLRVAQKLKHYTLILSNSPSFLVRPIAHFFNVDEWQATEYGVDQDRKLCYIKKVMQGDRKADYLVEVASRLRIEKADITAYSDSYLDLPFLLSAGQAVAVNPDRRLRRFSKKHSWRVI